MTAPNVSRLDRLLAAPMFAVTMIYLAGAGIAIHLVADESRRYADVVAGCGRLLLALHALYVVEVTLHWLSGGRHLRRNLLACLFPPLRLGSRDHLEGTQVWLPGLGWQQANDELAERLERNLGYPMICVALLVLPLLATELIYHEQIQEGLVFGLATRLVSAFIWLAFAAEFMTSISLVSKRVRYVKGHWVDVMIICLPLVEALRILRVARLAKLGRISKTARVFRLRGLAMRAWRAILILEIVDRVLHREPQKRLRLLRAQLAEKEDEAQALRDEIARLESRLLEQQAVPGEADQDLAEV